MATIGAEIRVVTRGTWRLSLCLFMMKIVVAVMEAVNRLGFRKDERPGTAVLDLTISGRTRAE